MKKLAVIIILTTTCLISSAQENADWIKQLTIACTGDSTLLTEMYEINLEKEKLYYISPIVNIKDIKGEKQRNQKKIDRQRWREIEDLINKINFSELDSINRENLEYQKYSIEIITTKNEIEKYSILNNGKFEEIEDLFNTIIK